MPGGGTHPDPCTGPSSSAPTRAEPGQTGGCRNTFHVDGVEMATPSNVCVVQPAGTAGLRVAAGEFQHEHKRAAKTIGAVARLNLKTTAPLMTLPSSGRFGCSPAVPV
jgi:hypothetical protein